MSLLNQHDSDAAALSRGTRRFLFLALALALTLVVAIAMHRGEDAKAIKPL